MKINSKHELYKYLDNFDWNYKRYHEWSALYFLIKYNGHTEAIYFRPYIDVWLESPCILMEFQLPDEKLYEFVKERYVEGEIDTAYEYESIFQKDGRHFEIINPQCSPFLPEEIEIIKVMSETECLEWLINDDMGKV